jgi:hypothetical protein
MTEQTKNGGGNQGDAAPKRSAPAPKLGKPYMDHRVLTRETKPDSASTVKTAS